MPAQSDCRSPVVETARSVGILAMLVNTPRFECRAGSRSRFNGMVPALVLRFGGAGMAAELAISHFPPCLTNVLM